MTSSLEAALQDPARLAALHEADLLDRPPVQSLDRFTRIASLSLGTPVALVTLLDRDRAYISNEVGLAEPLKTTREADLAHSYCKHVVANRAALIIEDARVHPTVKDNPSVVEHSAIAYAGIPILTRDNHVLGSFCVIDGQPRQWTELQLGLLRELAGAVSEEIDLRRRTARAEHLLNVLTDRILAEQQAAADRTAAAMNELHGPLGAMLSNVDLLRHHMSPQQFDELSRLLGTVRSSVEQATRLIGSISASATKPSSSLDVGPCVQQVCGEWTMKRPVTLDVEVLHSGHVELSSTQLQHCLESLLVNAERFASSRVLVRVDVLDAEVIVVVEDDGAGLATAHDYRTVWEARRSHRHDKGSGGSGLAIVKNVVTHVGGHVHARKSDLGGARFAIYLPITR